LATFVCPSPKRFSIGTWCRDAYDPSLGVGARRSPQNQGYLAHSKSYCLQCPWQPTDVHRPVLQRVKKRRSISASSSSTARSSQEHQPKRLSLRPHPALARRRGTESTSASRNVDEHHPHQHSLAFCNLRQNHFPDTDPVVVVHLASWVNARRDRRRAKATT